MLRHNLPSEWAFCTAEDDINEGTVSEVEKLMNGEGSGRVRRHPLA
ncbi:MAG: hypothetical protein J6B85_10000 [Lachnospiraceae bacterium]|nr:hypothetical protein [Lachnospiraceae bacterium]